MGLLHDKNHPTYFSDSLQPTSLEKFSTVTRRVVAKKQALEDVENEYNLLVKQALDTYKSEVDYIYFNTYSTEQAQKWLSMLRDKKDSNGNKLDKRKKYPEKISFEGLTYVLEKFLKHDIEITHILNGNHGEYWQIDFKCEGHEWAISIPNVKSVSTRTFLDDLRRGDPGCPFKLCIYHRDSKNSISSIGATFIEEELGSIMDTGIEKYRNKETE